MDNFPSSQTDALCVNDVQQKAHESTRRDGPGVEEPGPQDHDGLARALLELHLDGGELLPDDADHALDLLGRDRARSTLLAQQVYHVCREFVTRLQAVKKCLNNQHCKGKVGNVGTQRWPGGGYSQTNCRITSFSLNQTRSNSKEKIPGTVIDVPRIQRGFLQQQFVFTERGRRRWSRRLIVMMIETCGARSMRSAFQLDKHNTALKNTQRASLLDRRLRSARAGTEREKEHQLQIETERARERAGWKGHGRASAASRHCWYNPHDNERESIRGKTLT